MIDEKFRSYYYNFGFVVVALYEQAPYELSEYKSIIEPYIRNYFKIVMKIPYDFYVSVDYFETSGENTNISSFISEDAVFKEFAIRCKLLLTINDNNRMKITNPSQYQYMRDSESHFLKKFVHIV